MMVDGGLFFLVFFLQVFDKVLLEEMSEEVFLVRKLLGAPRAFYRKLFSDVDEEMLLHDVQVQTLGGDELAPLASGARQTVTR